MQPDDDKTRTYVPLTRDTMVSHYRIIEKIGAGGMGEVYLAEDTELNRKVALKFLPSHLCQDADCRTRFKREGQAAAKLNHPNIVTIYEVSEFNGRPFFAMENVEGQTLRDLSKGKELPLSRIVELAIQVCEGLAKAHTAGIVHRDIKPSNILIDQDGRAKIVDFGLASVRGSEPLTKTGSTLGTVGYMSPEQVRGEQVDQRTDLFSLGVVLYELITGHSPFKADTEAATLHAITNTDTEPLARYKTGVPIELERIIRVSLSKDRNLRYQHADEFAAEMKRLVIGVTVQPRQSWPARRTLTIALIGVGIIVAALAVKPWLFLTTSDRDAKTSMRRLVVVPFRNETGDSSFDPLGRVVADWVTQSLPGTGFGEVVPLERLPRNSEEMRVDAIADSSGADVLVMGSIYRPHDSLQFQVRVIRADGKLLRAIDPVTSSSSSVMDGVEAVRQKTLGALALELDVHLQDRISRGARPPIYRAYQEYMLGEQDYDAFRMEAALEHYRRACAEDTTFLTPLAKSAAAYWNLGRYDAADSSWAILESRRASMSEIGQLGLDESKALSSGNWERAFAISQQAAQLDPGPWSSFDVGWTAMAANCPREAITAFENISFRDKSGRIWSPYWDFYARAYHVLGDHERELSIALEGRQYFPEAWDVLDAVVRAYSALGNWQGIDSLLNDFQSRAVQQVECTQGRICSIGQVLQAAGEELRAHGFEEEAMTFFGNAVEWYQKLPAADLLSKRLEYAQVLAEHRQYPEARSLLEQLLKEEPDSLDYWGWLGVVAAKQGDQVVTQTTLTWLEGLKHRYGWHTYCRACIAAAMGDKEQAVALLRESIAQGKAYWIVDHREFAFENLRDYPPFIEILRPKG